MSEPDPSHRRRVLIIDDEEEFTELLSMNLLRTGQFEIGIVNDATKAVDYARSFKPDIILLDIVMPGIDGGDVASQLRSDPALGNIPVVLVSALVSNSEIGDDEIAQSGDRIVLAKPVKMDKLLRIVDQLTGTGS